ncbi:TAFII28-domain-containing protein [Cristinia sonorae]|uniref:TAFII28-domain-containing protein n=1 Tax=Cristinia sonorae TaxID=1940300 RepID=A0A8K0UWH7_9AGAR|nr:TAFII28-domain-containing protein [Cristinia sonorae]
MSSPNFVSFNPAARGGQAAGKTTAKRGRKPKTAGPTSAASSPRAPSQGPLPLDTQPTTLQWQNAPSTSSGTATFNIPLHPSAITVSEENEGTPPADSSAAMIISLPGDGNSSPTLAQDVSARTPAPAGVPGAPGAEDDVEGEDEMLPAMADDDYSAQLSFQSQSKDNLKVLMDNFSGAQYDRFEAYRRHALPKQAVRKQTLGQQVSQPVAQVVAGFAKVFVGEIVEKARAIQERRGDTGPISPDHLREAYRAYQLETGRVGAARPLKSKRLFVK